MGETFSKNIMDENLQIAILTGIYSSITCLMWYLISPACNA